MRLNNAVLWFPETMSRSLREFQSYIYLALLASCVVILVMTINDLDYEPAQRDEEVKSGKYFNEDVLKGAFKLPQFVKDLISK